MVLFYKKVVYGLLISFFFDKIFDETEPHKKKAWRSAREALLNITTPILSVEDVKNVKGIGKESLAFVDELLEQRKKNYFWKKMEEARKEYQGWHQWLWSHRKIGVPRGCRKGRQSCCHQRPIHGCGIHGLS